MQSLFFINKEMARAGLGFIAQYYHKILCYNQNVVYKDNK